MGKARGPKRKEAPARKRLQAGNPSNSALLHKQGRGKKGGGTHRAEGLDGGAAMGKRSLSQRLLAPNKRARGGKRRRKGDAPLAHQAGSSETAVIQAEYAAVDAREKAKMESEEARRLQAPVKVRLAPPTASLRMPSEGEASIQALRASSSARMVDALLQSITDDPAPHAPPARPVRSARRKRKGNPFAALEDDSSGDEKDSAIPDFAKFSTGGGVLGVGGSSSKSGGTLSFAAPSGFAPARISSSGSGETGFSKGVGPHGGCGSSGAVYSDANDEDDPDL